MGQPHNKALIPVNTPAPGLPKPTHPVVRFGSSALVALGSSPSLRKALFASAALGIGYKISIWARSGGLPQMAEDVRNIYRNANKGKASQSGELTGRRLRESVTLVTAVYGFLDGNENFPKR